MPDGVCCDQINVTMDGDVIKDVEFEGGCVGNGRALARLLAGMSADRAMEVLRGVECDDKPTSCADQFAKGLREQLEKGSA